MLDLQDESKRYSYYLFILRYIIRFSLKDLYLFLLIYFKFMFFLIDFWRSLCIDSRRMCLIKAFLMYYCFKLHRPSVVLSLHMISIVVLPDPCISILISTYFILNLFMRCILLHS